MRTPDSERQAQYRARKLAQGYRLVHGRFTLAPHVNARPGQLPPHGTERRYMHHGCRCTPCRKARRVARANRARVTPDV